MRICAQTVQENDKQTSVQMQNNSRQIGGNYLFGGTMVVSFVQKRRHYTEVFLWNETDSIPAESPDKFE